MTGSFIYVSLLSSKKKLEIFLEVKMPITNFSILLRYRDSLEMSSFQTNNLRWKWGVV